MKTTMKQIWNRIVMAAPFFLIVASGLVGAQTPPPDPTPTPTATPTVTATATPTPLPGCYVDLLSIRNAAGKHKYRIGNSLRLLLLRNQDKEWTAQVWYSIERVNGKKIRGAARRCSVSIPMDDDLSLKAKRIAKVLRKKQIEGEGERDDDDDGEADD